MTLHSVHSAVNYLNTFLMFVQLFGLWCSIRQHKISNFRDEVYHLSHSLETQKALDKIIAETGKCLLLNQPYDLCVAIGPPEHFLRLPSPAKMLFSTKPIKLESYFTTLEIIELTGTIPIE